MQINRRWRRSGAALGVLATLANPMTMMRAAAQTSPPLTLQQKVALLQQKVKYVFVIFHENESFDHFFGTFPGANGLFSAPAGFTPANQTTSFTQRYLDTSLNPATTQPFLMPQAVVASNGERRAGLSGGPRSRWITATRAWRTTCTSIRPRSSPRTTAMR